MNTLKRLVFLMIAIAALVGCGRDFVINTAQLTSNLAVLDIQYEKTAAMIASRADQFEPAEREQLRLADQRIQALRSAAHLLISDRGGVAAAIVQADQVRLLYDAATAAYASARYVICPNTPPGVLVSSENCIRLSLLPEYEQALLVSFDRQAHSAQTSILNIIASPAGVDITQMLYDVLSLGATAARVARLGLI